MGGSNYIFERVCYFHCYTEIQLSVWYLIGGESSRKNKSIGVGSHPLSVLEAQKENTCFRLGGRNEIFMYNQMNLKGDLLISEV